MYGEMGKWGGDWVRFERTLDLLYNHNNNQQQWIEG